MALGALAAVGWVWLVVEAPESAAGYELVGAGSGALTSSSDTLAPQTRLTLLMAKVASPVVADVGVAPGMTPVTLNGAAGPVLTAAACPLPLDMMSGFDCWSDWECLVTPC